MSERSYRDDYVSMCRTAEWLMSRHAADQERIVELEGRLTELEEAASDVDFSSPTAGEEAVAKALGLVAWGRDAALLEIARLQRTSVEHIRREGDR